MAWELMRVERPDYGGRTLILTRDPGNPQSQTISLYVSPQLLQQLGTIDPENLSQVVRNWVQGHLDTQDAAAAFEARFDEAVANVRETAAGKLDVRVELIRQYLVDHPGVTGAQAKAAIAPGVVAMYAACDSIGEGFV